MSEHKNLIIHLGEWWETRKQKNRSSGRWRWLPSPGSIFFTLLVAMLLIVTQKTWATSANNLTNSMGTTAHTINYQGSLADIDGTPIHNVAPGLSMTFTIYDAATGGSAMWSETHANVPITNGLFNVGLGSQTSGGIPIDIWNGDRYLEIHVGNETLQPRELIRNVPSAAVATMAQTAQTAQLAYTVPDGAIASRHVHLSSGRASISVNTFNMTSAFQEVPGMSLTVTPETAQTYLVTTTCDMEGSGGTGICALYVNGSRIGGQALFRGGSTGERATVSQVHLVNLDAGTHTLAVHTRITAGSGRLRDHSRITYLAISQ